MAGRGLEGGLWRRELGGEPLRAGRTALHFPGGGGGGAGAGGAALLRRLTCEALGGQGEDGAGHQASINALQWSQRGDLLASCSDDCRVALWDVSRSRPRGFLETGHTGSVFGVSFLPGSGGGQLVTCSADKQVRLLDVARGASKPFGGHAGRVRAVAALEAATFVSSGDDGLIKQFDARERPAGGGGGGGASGARATLAAQRPECAPVGGTPSSRVSVMSLAVDPIRPWRFATGGGDTLGAPLRPASRACCLSPPLLTRALP
jgi:hypothetical protein